MMLKKCYLVKLSNLNSYTQCKLPLPALISLDILHFNQYIKPIKLITPGVNHRTILAVSWPL